MSNEIKFRAFHKDIRVIIPYGEMSCNKESFVYGRWALLSGFLQNEDYHVMQFTQMRDKNGVEIYEGDIIGEGTNADVVVFRYGTFSVYGQPLGWDVETYDESPEEIDTAIWAVVTGNIYENPELMEDSKYRAAASPSIHVKKEDNE